MKTQPLQGIRILDLSRLLPGPFCTLLLADLGAEIIKVEDAARGDYARYMAPFIGNDSAYFLALNLGKKSLALNLKSQKGREIFLKLATTADVILENFRPGTVDRLGIGYKDVQKVNPQVVYCSISGYGQDGPNRDRAGHDLNYLARSGILDLSGQADGPPAVLPVQIADLSSAMYATIAILATLQEINRTRKGRYLDIGMLESTMSWLVMTLAEFAAGECCERGQLPLTGKYPCYNIYQTKDGQYISLAALEFKFWAAFCKATDREDLLPHQYSEKPETFSELRAHFASRTLDEWITLLHDVDCCFEPVQSLNEALSDPQVRHRRLILNTSVAGKSFFRLSNPLRFHDEGDIGTAPQLGEHTYVILQELGYDDSKIAELERAGIILNPNSR